VLWSTRFVRLHCRRSVTSRLPFPPLRWQLMLYIYIYHRFRYPVPVWRSNAHSGWVGRRSRYDGRDTLRVIAMETASKRTYSTEDNEYGAGLLCGSVYYSGALKSSRPERYHEQMRVRKIYGCWNTVGTAARISCLRWLHTQWPKIQSVICRQLSATQ
jgi:hypothetical protein